MIHAVEGKGYRGRAICWRDSQTTAITYCGTRQITCQFPCSTLYLLIYNNRVTVGSKGKGFQNLNVVT